MNKTRRISWLVAALLIAAAATTGRTQEAPAKLGDRLAQALAAADPTADIPLAVWVRFADKGVAAADMPAALAAAADLLTPAARARRARNADKGAGIVDSDDLPLCSDYLAAVTATGATLRQQSRWLNASSWEATPAQIAAVARLPFVTEIDRVAGGRGARPELREDVPEDLQAALEALPAHKSLGELDYGPSWPGLDQANVPAVHTAGLTGRGVTVALLDTGFEVEHDCLQHLDVVATWDFVNGDEYVGDRPEESIYQTIYGTASLSVLAGFDRSNIVGAAWGVSVILAKTEDLADETPVEEDNWIAALEWAEGLGADVVSSGIGYYYWYDFSALDGRTAAISVAAEMAVARGVCVVNQVGNERGNVDWPHLIAPADAAGVIAVGACDLNGQVTFYSSPGPTADGRIKPDVLALGSGVPVAFSLLLDRYQFGAGANYAAPLVAGIVALMLEGNPSLSPAQVMADLHAASNRANLPDNDFGWGIPDALAAVTWRQPRISHVPLPDREANLGPYAVTATITGAAGIDPDRSWVAWRLDGGAWQLAPLAPAGGDTWSGQIPSQPAGRTVDYYLVATGLDGLAAREPAGAPQLVHSFRQGQDITPPQIEHQGLVDQVPAAWPPIVRARVTDNLGVGAVNFYFTINGGANQGPYAMTLVADHYELAFPLPPQAAQPGLALSYLIFATDTATVPNITGSGPHTFGIVADRGRVLVVDDRGATKAAAPAGRGAESALAEQDKTAADLAGWLRDAGFSVDVIAAAAVTSASFLGYDAVMVSCGGSFAPLSYAELQRAMITWTQDGGRLLVEGGEVTFAVCEQPGHPQLKEVLHISAYAGEDGSRLRVPAELDRHPFANRPHRLPNPVIVDNNAGGDYSAADLADAADDAFVAMRVGSGSNVGGVIAYDDDTGPAGGQTLFFPFNLMRTVETEGRLLLDNAMTYLTAPEDPGPSVVSGRVILAGRDQFGGVVVDCGRGRETVTAADGTWSLDGLWGGSYRVTASAPGFASQVKTVDLAEGETATGEDFYLLPVVEHNLTAAPGASIPDNNPAGITSDIMMTAGGTVRGLTVDVDISHFSVGNLVVTLTSPAGTSVTLHNRSGGTADNLVGTWPVTLFVDGPGALEDFHGENPQGAWTLRVADQQFGGTGTFNTWGLNLLVTPVDAAAVGAGGLPQVTRLVGNTPNPFNPRTVIAFELARSGSVRLDVYDLRGRLVRQLEDRTYTAGRHAVVWDGRSENGGEPASGLYFCRLRTDDGVRVHKMTLLR